MRFEDYWENYGELHASMCGGNIKQFAKEIWMSANVNTDGVRCCGCGDCKKEVPDEKAESAVSGKICNTCKGNGEWVDVEFREITVCPDCNGTGIISKTCHTYTDTKMPFGIYAPEPDQSKDTERLNTKNSQSTPRLTGAKRQRWQ